MHPDRDAIIYGDRRFTYHDLNRQARLLADRLQAMGAGPETVVGVHLPRGADLIPALLGVLLSGAAYLPLDPANPPARLAGMLAETDAVAMVTTGEYSDRRPATDVPSVFLDSLCPDTSSSVPPAASRSPATVAPENLAYVIYTSGSTGTPKGVMVQHGSLAGLVTWHQRAYGCDDATRMCQFTTPAFDASVWEIWPVLAAGGTLLVPDSETLPNPSLLQTWLLDNDITLCNVPPVIAEALFDLPWPAGAKLHTIVTGGDRLHRHPGPELPFRLVNEYGPTECTVTATAGSVAPGARTLPDIGRPIDHVTAHVLGPDLATVPTGVIGELYLGGPQLARGYLHRPDLTAERFVPHPLAEPGGRLYRTGDLVSTRADGTLDFHGRADHQIKLRGYRIEPAEIERALTGHPDVASAHVIKATADPGDEHLIAYVVLRDTHRIPTARQLREHLASILPTYMCPQRYVVLEQLPMTPGGKVDATALPAPRHGGAAATPYTAPGTPLEQALTEIWGEVLRADRVGIHDDLFDLGGHSLLATRITTRVRTELGWDLSVAALFANPTVAQLAAFLTAGRAPAATEGLPPLRPHPRQAREPLSYNQEQVWLIGKLNPDSIAYQTQTTIRVLGRLDRSLFKQALNEIVRRHEILRTSYAEDTDGTPWQVVGPPYEVSVDYADLSDVPVRQRDTRVAELVHRELRTRFDLSRGPLFRWTILRLGDQEYEIVLVEHHLVHDGWSFVRLVEELAANYNALAAGRPALPADLPIQYADFARWQRENIDRPAMRAQLAYWRERLANAPATLNLHTDRPRPRTQGTHGGLVRVGQTALTDPKQRLNQLSLTNQQQRHQMLTGFNPPPITTTPKPPAHTQFTRQAHRTPGAIAAIHGDHHITYGQLNTNANRLAHLLKALDAKPDHPIGVCLPRGIPLLIAILAITKTGAPYLPLDPDNPPHRITHMAETAGLTTIVTTTDHTTEVVNSTATLITLDTVELHQRPDTDPPEAAHPDNLAYVIYTSGSTGRPKGVMITHRSLTDLITWHHDTHHTGHDDHTTLVAAPGFDASTWEIWPPLTAGATIHIPGQHTLLSPTALQDWLQTNHITQTFLPTPLAETLLTEHWPGNIPLHLIDTGGDRLHIRPHPKHPFTLINNYGPTENTVVATSATVSAHGTTPPPIGKPLPHTRIYILDNALHPVPIGIPGEIHLAGTGLARGYLNRPDLTAERFIPNPYANHPGDRLYRTGDRARWLPDGTIDYLGRIDRQIKLRGYRIEPGEIEAALRNHPHITAAVVTTHSHHHDTRLSAYITTDKPITTEDIRRHLARQLPAYMIPATITALPTIPLTPNGKPDLKALPTPAPSVQTGHQPRNPTERALTTIWTDILNSKNIGIHDNFFDLGGHSLLAVKIISRIYAEFDIELPVTTIFEHPTIAGTAGQITRRCTSETH